MHSKKVQYMDLTLQFPGLFEIEVQTRTLQTRKFKVRTNSLMESFFISKNFSFASSGFV